MAQNIGILTGRTAKSVKRTQRGSWLGLVLTALVSLIVLLAVVLWQFSAAFDGQIYPGVSVAGVPVGGLTPDAAAAKVQRSLAPTANERIVLRAGDREWAMPLDRLGVVLDVDATIERVYAVGRNGSPLDRPLAWWQTLRDGHTVSPVLHYDPVATDAVLAQLARELHRDRHEARVAVIGLVVHSQPAVTGRTLDVDASAERIRAAIDAGETGPIELVLTEQQPLITSTEPAASQAKAILDEPFRLHAAAPEWRQTADGYTQHERSFTWTLDQTQLAEMVSVVPVKSENGQREWRIQLDTTSLRAELNTIAAQISQSPRDARFDYDPNTGALQPLVISQPGLSLNVDGAVQAIEDALVAGQNTLELPIQVTQPRVSTADASKINIQGAAGVGRSTFGGSPDGREQNIAVAASRFNGVVVPPGGEFSFNEYLGDVVDATGYEESYIILGDRTAVGVGGGVCQVSTTLFRAALFGGFAITERHAHGYRVAYYEPPIGLDATIYSPYVDLKFKNDTENYYIIESEVDLQANEMAFYLYGADTGRQVEVTDPVMLETIPHGEPIYTEDPSLPQGVTKQIDWAHDGARVRVERIVRDDAGNVIHQDTFWSEYRPWVSRYLVGTGPSATETAAENTQ